jgi:hypothetical protein
MILAGVFWGGGDIVVIFASEPLILFFFLIASLVPDVTQVGDNSIRINTQSSKISNVLGPG